MAKQKDLTPLKKGVSTFNLVGRAKVNQYTFNLDKESKESDWVYNQMNLSVDCGAKSGSIRCEMMGGYGSERDNFIFAHGVKEDESGKKVDDFKKTFKIAWDDRFDEDVIEEVGSLKFITVGLEKNDDATVYKKFLTEYDAIQYIESVLEDGMIVNVKGSLVYQEYKENISVKKQVKSIVLSKAEEDGFKAVFNQDLVLDYDCVGTVDKETNTMDLTARVIEYVKDYRGDLVKTFLPLPKTFFVSLEGDAERVKKMLKMFRPKKNKIYTMVVEGIFTRGASEIVEVTDDMLTPDIVELIELGFIDRKEIEEKMAFQNGGNSKPEIMIITRPVVKIVEGKPALQRVEDLYSEDDLEMAVLIENAIEKLGGTKKVVVEDVLDSIEEDEDDEDDDSWLSSLS